MVDTRTLEPRPVPVAHGWRWIIEAVLLYRRQPVTWNLMFLVLIGFEAAVFYVQVLQLFGWLVEPVLTAGVLVAAATVRTGQRTHVGQLFTCFSADRRLLRLLLLRLLLMLGMLVIFFIACMLSWTTFGDERIKHWTATLATFDPAHFNPALLDTELLSFLALVISALAVPLMMAAFFAPARVVLDDRPVVTALRESFRACLRNLGPFLIYGLAFLGLLLLAMVPAFVVGAIGTSPGSTDHALRVMPPVLMLEFLIFRPVLSLSVFTAYGDLFPRSSAGTPSILSGAR
jgi:hypothetical protein